jgi:hypothetical protein
MWTTRFFRDSTDSEFLDSMLRLGSLPLPLLCSFAERFAFFSTFHLSSIPRRSYMTVFPSVPQSLTSSSCSLAIPRNLRAGKLQ